MNSNQLLIKMIMDRWSAQINNFDTALNAFTDEQMQREIAPGKNRGIYLLGHLVAVHDDMFPLLDLGDKIFPELNAAFKSPDKSVAEIPTAKELRTCWNKINEVMNQKFSSMQPEDWFQRHTSVSAEDFAREPHRNKLNIILTRTTHLSYHLGQFILLK
ncbi:hypothetical protein BH11BAC1_BH11BAC1_23010 [soil metagenome]